MFRIFSRTLVTLLTLSVALARPSVAQVVAPAVHREAARWSLDGAYEQLGAGPIRRQAPASMSLTLGRDLGTGPERRAWRAEAGWMRAARRATTAEGVTLGLSLALPWGGEAAGGDGSRFTLRPGVALMAGWARAQDSAAFYDWLGQPGTPYADSSGTQTTPTPARGHTAGAGLSLAAEWRIARGVGVTGSLRQWAFGGSVIRPNRHATLAGVGLALRPAVLAADTRRLWRARASEPAMAMPAVTIPTVTIPTVTIPVSGTTTGSAR